MKKIIVIIFCILISISGGFFLFNKNVEANMSSMNKEINTEIKIKGLEEANTFTFDENNNIYIGTDNGIEVFDSNGKSYAVLNQKGLKIYSMIYKDNKLYFTCDDRLCSYDISTKKNTILIDNLPNKGDYKECYIALVDKDIYISIGAATNSGVVSDESLAVDKTPIELVLKGNNYGDKLTGGFSAFGSKTKNGQIIQKNFPGNASVIKYNISKKSCEPFASGIRNIEGFDFDSEGSLIAVVGGMENRGLRPVEGDTDYIYEIKKGVWYGWPDYSGGDPLDSPKFQDNSGKPVKMLLSKLPMNNPPAPFYVHNKAGSMYSLAVDRYGNIQEKDSMFFYDAEDKLIYNLNRNGLLSTIFKFRNKVDIKDMKIINKNLYILDKKNGVLYQAKKEQKAIAMNSKNIIFSLLCVIILIIVIFVAKASKVKL